MQPMSVLPVEGDRASDPWPGILKILAQTTIAFAALTGLDPVGHLLRSIIAFKNPGDSAQAVPVTTIFLAGQILSALQVAVSVLLVIAGAIVLKWQAKPHLILLGARLWIAIWLLGMVVHVVVVRRAEPAYLAASVLKGATVAAFPLLTLFLFREYRMDRPR